MENRRAGIVVDVSTVLSDLLVLYRVPGISPSFTDPNPPPPPTVKRAANDSAEMSSGQGDVAASAEAKDGGGKGEEDENLKSWRAILHTSDAMFHYKNGPRGRNMWQTAQHGGQGEAFHYDAAGFAEGVEVITEAGKEVFRRKWGHRGCDLITGAGLNISDQWQAKKDWR